MIIPQFPRRVAETTLVLWPNLTRAERRKKATGDDLFKKKRDKKQPKKRRPKPFGHHNKDRYHR